MFREHPRRVFALKNKIGRNFRMNGLEVIPPVAPSPLDSMRGRGKCNGLSRTMYTSCEKKHTKGKSIVILVLPENTSKPIVGYKNGHGP